MPSKQSAFFGLFLSFCLLLGWGVQAWCATVKEIAHDMSPVEGYILLASDGEYLVDLDASHRVALGDLLALVVPGQKITHPVTGAVIGQLTAVKGYLEVTKVASGFSSAVLIWGEAPVRGAKVRRFEGVRAYFQGDGPLADALYPELRSKLNQFKWKRLAADAQPLKGDTAEFSTLFRLQNANLRVTTLAGKSLRGYVVDDIADAQVQSPNTVPSKPRPKQLVFPDGTSNLPEGIVRVRKARRTDEYWKSGIQKGVVAGITVGMFSPGQKTLAVTLTGETKLYRLPIEETVGAGTIVDTPDSVTPLAVEGFDLNGDGLTELYVSGRLDDRVSSYVIDFSGGAGKVVASGLPWLFNRVQVSPGKWVLAAQRPDEILRGGGSVFRVASISNGKVQLGGALKKPLKGHIYSFSLYPNSEGVFTANFAPNDRLELYNRNGALRWRSDERFGGSDAYLLSRRRGEDEYHYLSAPMKVAPGGELLVPMNLGQTLFRIRSYNSSHLKAMRIEGGELVEIWRTKKQNGYLSDFEVVDFDGDGKPNLLLVVQFSNSTLISPGEYAFVAYELPEGVN